MDGVTGECARNLSAVVSSGVCHRLGIRGIFAAVRALVPGYASILRDSYGHGRLGVAALPPRCDGSAWAKGRGGALFLFPAPFAARSLGLLEGRRGDARRLA